ncbi:MAG: hypothetical protein ABIJ12_05725 [bacterium]
MIRCGLAGPVLPINRGRLRNPTHLCPFTPHPLTPSPTEWEKGNNSLSPACGGGEG